MRLSSHMNKTLNLVNNLQQEQQQKNTTNIFNCVFFSCFFLFLNSSQNPIELLISSHLVQFRISVYVNEIMKRSESV